jgi:hypothetical protein
LALALAAVGVALLTAAPAGSDAALLLPAWFLMVGSVVARHRAALDPRLHLGDRHALWWEGLPALPWESAVPAEPPAPPEPVFAWYLPVLALLPLGLPVLALSGRPLGLMNGAQSAALGGSAGVVVFGVCQWLLFRPSVPLALRVAGAAALNAAGYALVLGVLLSKG